MFYIKSMHNTPMYSDVNIGGYKFLDLHLLGPVIAYGEEGEAGQVLTAQGGNVPPKWEDPSGGGGSLPTLGTAGQMLQVNAGATALEYFTPSFFTLPSFTSGSVIFSDGSTLAQDNANFFWDDTNNRLGIGTTSPVAKLSVRRDNIGVTQDNSYGIILNNTTAAVVGGQQMSPPIVWRGQGWKTNATAASQSVDFRADVLPVQGSSAPTGVWQLSSSINGGAYTTINSINSDGGVNILYNSATGNMLDIRRIGTSDRYITFGATGKFDTKSVEVSTSAYSFASGANNTNTTGARLFCNFTSNFSPTSGTATHSTMELLSTVNQTGGANGITRGIYVNPTLTAAADWRAIETTAGSFKMADTYLAGSGSLAGSLIDLTQTWNTTGTPTAIKLNVTDTASNASSLLMDLQVGGSTKFNVTKAGAITAASNIFGNGSVIRASGTAYFSWNARSRMASSADGNVTLTNDAITDFGLLQFGGTTSAFPALKRSGSGLVVRLADDSGGANLTANNFTSNGYLQAETTSAIFWTSRSRMYSPANANILLQNNAQTDFSLLQFGGTTSSFPAIKRNAAAIDIRLADDSAYTDLNSGRVTITPPSLTGSSATSALDIAQTWNTTGTPTAIKLNVTDAASNASSLLMDLQVGGGSKYKINKTGWTQQSSYGVFGSGATVVGNGSDLLYQGSGTNGSIKYTSANNWSLSAIYFLSIGGSTSSFPALKRNSAALEVRLADDSATAGLIASYLNLDKTITTSGTTGDQTINKASGSVNFAAAATSLTVTNSLVSGSSVIICTVATNDATMKSVAVRASSGSFVIYANAAATAETQVNFLVLN